MNEAHSLHERTIAEHARFVRGLARGLLRDEGVAEDVAQETWMALLQRGSVARVGAWMDRVVRRTAGRWRRTSARRYERERQAARNEALPSTLDAVARAELIRAVGEAVAALEAPYRDVLLLRFYDGLAPREIARKLGLPIATVKTRLQRAQERVRARLCLRERGRENWLQALTWLAFGDPRASFLSGAPLLFASTALMKLKTISLLLLVLLLGLGTWRFGRPAAPALEREGPSGIHDNVLSDSASREATASRTERLQVETIPATAGAQRATALLQGRVRDAFGRVLPGAEVWVGVRPDELSARTQTDEQGSFELVVEDDAAWIGALAAGWAPSPLVEVHAPFVEPLELVLPSRGAGLTVTVRGPANAPVAGARVFVGRREELELRLPDGRGGRSAPGFALTSDSRGVAHFTGLAPGWVRVEVSHPELAPSQSFLTLWPPEDQVLEIGLQPGFTVAGVVRDSFGPVVGATARAGLRSVESGPDGAFRVGPIAAGKITAEDPSGRRAQTELVGAAGSTLHWDALLGHERLLGGRVVSAQGTPVAGATVSANRDTWPGWNRSVRTDEQGGFALFDCPDEERLRLEVRRDALDELPALVQEGVEADQDLVLCLPGEGELARLQGAFTPAPAVHARVLLRRPAAAGRLRLTGGEGLPLVLDDEGYFERASLPPGEYELVLLGEPYGWYRAASFVLAPGADCDLGWLELPRPGMLRVESATGSGPMFTSARFLLERRDEQVRILELAGAFPAELALAPGAYALEAEVQPGPRRVIPFTVIAGAETLITLELDTNYMQRVRVRRASGVPAAGVLALEAHAVDPLARPLGSAALTPDADGAWSGEVEAAPCRVEFRAQDGSGQVHRVEHDLHGASSDEVLELVLEDRTHLPRDG